MMFLYKIGDWKPITGVTAVSVVRIRRVTRRTLGLGMRAFWVDFTDEEMIYKIKLVEDGTRITWDIMNVKQKREH